MSSYSLSYLKQLESESIHIIREVVAECKNPVMLYSVGKDSSVMVRLAQKAFYPGKFPFPLMHVDTKYKFQEMYEFRDQFCKDIRANLIVHCNEEWIEKGSHPLKLGTDACCGHLKTAALLEGLRIHGFDAAFGGARREEEKSRAKERVCSIRDEFGQWDPKNQRPELWDLYNTRLNEGQSIRVFPLSNWTEIDIWQYIKLESIPVVPLYFAQKRGVIERNGMLILESSYHVFANDPKAKIADDEIETAMCRFRSLGCMPCTGAVRSMATTIDEIIEELQTIRKSERENRLIDHGSDSAMEDKKKEGYF
ncbi:sulfate adenylyltransferase subunit CysD [candidate division KSB3 bacterium]|uniref:Sulfate adenylyltransferase subunit 2 n=1 Tax=candidate division KSB3 bacterium TaxID=2044937 RepID=A0A2G6KI75_9BACT|nr:MAG: sulfate adenylyltransferase subunit CysD [candidate division KSB3 bacterium]